MERLQQKFIAKDLDRKMVVLTGPRQVGKTILARSLSAVWPDLEYLNWDAEKDRNHREADFLVTKDQNPWFLIEAKLSEVQPAAGLEYFSRRLGVPGIQVILKEKILKKAGNILIVSANRWLGNLP